MMSRKLALRSVRELSFTNYFLGSSMGETKAHGLKRLQIKGFKRRGAGWGVRPPPLLCLISGPPPPSHFRLKTLRFP